jgi:hypothetical protein
MKDNICKRGHVDNWHVSGNHRACRDCRNESVKRSRILLTPREKLESRRKQLIEELAYVTIQIAIEDAGVTR